MAYRKRNCGSEHSLGVVERHHQMSAPSGLRIPPGRWCRPRIDVEWSDSIDSQSPAARWDPRRGGRPPRSKSTRRIAGCPARSARNTVRGVRGRQCCTVVDGIDLGRGKGRVQGQAQVGPGAFQVGRHCKRAANHSVAAQYRRSPRETDAWLEVPSAIEAVVEAPAGSALAGKVDIARRHVVVSLTIVGFNPRGVCFVAQAEIQRQAIGIAAKCPERRCR